MSDVKQLYNASIVLDTLREIVKEYGEDYIYDPEGERDHCAYAEKDGSPSCIAGHLLYRLAPDVFEHVRAAEAERGSSAMFVSLHTRFGVELPFTPLAVMVAGAAQTKQDTGRTWGHGLKAAEEIAASLDYPDIKES